MSSSDYEWEESEGCSQAKDLENALGCKCLQDMLQGRTGAFSSRYWFINEYINYVNLLASDSSINSQLSYLKRENVLKMFMILSKILSIL